MKSISLEKFNFSVNAQLLNSLKVDSIILSSVSDHDNLLAQLHKLSDNVILLTHMSPTPIKNLYKSPETLGKDRLAAIVGAMSIFPNNNLLTIDAGTCITMDFLNKKAEYFGGSISPGIQMRLKAMHSYTSKLPELLWTDEGRPELIGDTTASSMLSGAVNGTLAELKGSIQLYLKKYRDLKILLTGGDSSFFEKELKNGIFADSNLVLKGLNEILLYNRENH